MFKQNSNNYAGTTKGDRIEIGVAGGRTTPKPIIYVVNKIGIEWRSMKVKIRV